MKNMKAVLFHACTENSRRVICNYPFYAMNPARHHEWMETVGEIMSSDSGEFFWMLPELTIISLNCCISSPRFTFDQENWRLVMCPSYNSEGIQKAWNSIDLFLWMESRQKIEQMYDVQLSYRNLYGGPSRQHNGETLAEFGFGRKGFIAKHLVPTISCHGRTKIHCTIKKKEDNLDLPISSPENDERKNEITNTHKDQEKDNVDCRGIERLIENFKKLLHNEWGSDVTLKNGDHEFRAHMTILGARSPVFASMFQHDMIEKKTKEVDISDCSTGGFQVFLEFLYTGNADTMSSDNVVDLYYIADKYQVDDLKADCVQYMKNILSVDNFCDIMALSIRHGESDLQNYATQFFCKNIKKIVKTIQWKTYISENPIQANELYITAINA